MSNPFVAPCLRLTVSPTHAQAGATNPFVGSWKLIAVDKILPDGSRFSDYGAEPHGMAVFTADGHMMIDVSAMSASNLRGTCAAGWFGAGNGDAPHLVAGRT